MGDGVAVTVFTPSQLTRRVDRLQDYLDAWGDLSIRDIGAAGDVRLVEFLVDAPGSDLPTDVRLLYREYYRRAGRGRWHIAKYTYEYVDLRSGRRLAYHLHDLLPRRLVPHAHCGSAVVDASQEPREHFRAVEYDLREAHEAFMRLYAADLDPDCAAFLPLDVDRTP